VIQRSFQELPTVFARLKGRNGVAREYKAVIVPTTDYCVVPMVDAFALGYPEAAGADARALSPNPVHFATYSGYGRGLPVKMAEVEIGGTSFKDVDFIAFDVLQAAGFDVVLGRSLLKGLTLEIDYGSHRLSLRKASGGMR
jgi:hypothetical protein